jgi:hypothetical protein
MNIAQLSNLFNQICLGINASAGSNRVGFYHYGFYSDINTNIQNNWTGGNTLGKYYPAVSFVYPRANVAIQEKGVKGSLSCVLYFSDLQYYNNDGTTNQRSILEVHRDLEALAINVLSEFNRIGRTKDYQAGLIGNVDLDYLSDAHNDRLCIVEARFNVWYVFDCPIDTADIAALPAGFNDIPPTSNDLELV